MNIEQHMANGRFLLGECHNALVKVYSLMEELGQLPDGAKEEMESISMVYDCTMPYNRDISDRIHKLSKQLLAKTH